jgi:hypothetical protein
MAYSPLTTNLPRRRTFTRFFVGIAAATIVGRAATTASETASGCPNADAQLFACWREYLKSEIELNAVEVARDQTSWKVQQAYPPKPDCMAAGRMKIIPSKFEAEIGFWAAAMDMTAGQQPTAEQMSEIKAWVQRCNAINIRFGLPKLESAFKAAWDRQWAAFARFVATPATTLAGLALKTSAIFYFEDQACRAWRGNCHRSKAARAPTADPAYTEERYTAYR